MVWEASHSTVWTVKETYYEAKETYCEAKKTCVWEASHSTVWERSAFEAAFCLSTSSMAYSSGSDTPD